MRVMVFAAHPDDELLGAGATLARHGDRGDEVHAVVLAEGATSRYESEMKRRLEESGRRAAGVLGLAAIRFESFPDQRLDTVPLIEVTQKVEALVEEIAPQVIYTHFRGDVNADHQVVAQAVWTACRPYRFPDLRLLAAFETPSATEWGWPDPAESFSPNRFVDVTETLDRKVQALECYESELRDYPHPRSARAIRERAGYWGSIAAMAAAEPFLVLRERD